MNPWKPRLAVGPADEPDRYVVLLAHDRGGPGRTGVGANFFGSHASRHFGPFVAILTKDRPDGTHYLVELRPVRPTWNRRTSWSYQEAVRDVARILIRQREGWTIRTWTK